MNSPQSHSPSKRRFSTVASAGCLTIGGQSPIRIQSMTNTPTLDVDATTKQCIALAESGCELIRITAQNLQAAKALKEIREKFSAAGFSEIPIAADIHFLPNAALEAIEHVEKVRVNPGNFIDKKKFAIREYSDIQYQEELDHLYQAFSPLVLRAKALGKCLRIGTNHGSLSDRIMNKYGDTPLGMVESALEFARIAESHNFHNFVFSFKASNPKVMTQAYRLACQKMSEENMHYPLHLGVTEAGLGEDARIKSAIGIGSLLLDGIGDTIRVSLTEDPVHEIPVAQKLAHLAHSSWLTPPSPTPPPTKANQFPLLSQFININSKQNNRFQDKPCPVLSPYPPLPNNSNPDTKPEGLILQLSTQEDLTYFNHRQNTLPPTIFTLLLPPPLPCLPITLPDHTYIYTYKNPSPDLIENFHPSPNTHLALDLSPSDQLPPPLLPPHVILTSSTQHTDFYRYLASTYPDNPIWIRVTNNNTIAKDPNHILEASLLAGSLLIENIGNLLSIEYSPLPSSPDFNTHLAFNILQAARLRMTKTEFVACPSCGRTLFDLESTTLAIKEKTGHLKNVTIAIMGCIVNGPGEMADAHFGYVGGAPNKINLYVGKQCVKYNIPQDLAVDELINLIKQHNKWVDPA